MAVIEFFRGLDVLALIGTEAAEVAGNEDIVNVTYPDGSVLTYLGQFTFDDQGRPAGPIDRMDYSGGGVLFARITEVDVPIEQINADGGFTSISAIARQVWAGDDTFVGSDERDVFDSYLGADALFGGGGGDLLFGFDGDDLVAGEAGDDTLLGGRGDDVLEGGAGRDLASYDAAPRDFVLAVSRAGVTVTDRAPDGLGSDRLVDVEAVEFLRSAEGADPQDPGADDVTIPLDLLTGITALSEAEITTFVEMYIAYFDRAPDAEGLFYWGTRLADGMTKEEIARSFFVQDETVALYPDAGDNAFLVDNVYRNLLERDPDAPGRAYWIEQLELGTVERGEFILAVIDGAKEFADPDAAPELIAQAEADVRTISDKADIGLYYAAIQGLNDVDQARAAMAAYDPADAAAGLAEAQAIADAAAESPTDYVLQLTGVVDDPFAIA